MNKPAVVIVHGLWLHGRVMTPLKSRLRRQGFEVHAFSYPSMRRFLSDNVESLAQFIQALKASTIYLVAHSMGGLLCLTYCAHHSDPRLNRMVLLGSPVRGSTVAARLAQLRMTRWLLGKSWRDLTQGVPARAPAMIGTGVIAGELGAGLGRLVTNLTPPHDGTVRVAETQLEGAADQITVRTSHTGLIFSPVVAAQVAHFLQHGRFMRRDQPTR